MTWRKEVSTYQETSSLWVAFIVEEGALEVAGAGGHQQSHPAVNPVNSNSDCHQDMPMGAAMA